MTANAHVAGILGGGGGDDIINDGAIIANANATTDADNVSVVPLGAAFSNANTTANAFAVELTLATVVI